MKTWQDHEMVVRRVAASLIDFTGKIIIRRKLLFIVLLLDIVLTSAVKADLVGWWKFDEGSGTTAKDPASTNDGIVIFST